MSRFRFITQRPVQLLPVLVGISVITFFLLHSIPGDPVRTILGEKATAETVAALRAHYGLDQPVVMQYLLYVKNLFLGDLGQSIVYKIDVTELVWSRVPPTLWLLVYAVVLSLVMAIPLAVISALYQGRLADHLIRSLTTVGLGFPAFWVGIMLILVFSVWLGLFPVAGYGETFLERLHHLFLPALTIALALSAILIRTLRANLLETLNADFVTAAHAKGLTNRRVFWGHVLRASLVPTVTLLGVNIGWLIGGTVVIETVYSVPGLGKLMVQSIFSRDYFVVQSLTLAFACATVLVTFTVDVVTALLDPRIQI